MARDDDETEIRREPDRWVTPEETTVERVEVERSVPPPAPGAAPEAEEAVVHERQTVRQRDDGAIETETVRHEERRRWSGGKIAALVAALLLLLAAAAAAVWYFTEGSQIHGARPSRAGRSTRRSPSSRRPI